MSGKGSGDCRGVWNRWGPGFQREPAKWSSSGSGAAIVQLFVAYPNTKVRRPVKEFKAWKRVALEPGEKKTVQLTVPARDLAYYDKDNGWTLEFVEHQVLVGPNADKAKLLGKPFTIKKAN